MENLSLGTRGSGGEKWDLCESAAESRAWRQPPGGPAGVAGPEEALAQPQACLSGSTQGLEVSVLTDLGYLWEGDLEVSVFS